MSCFRTWSCCLLLLAVVLSGCGEKKKAIPMEERETVVLLHGMGRTRVSMALLQRHLEKAGYETLNFPYSSRSESFQDITTQLHAFVNDKVKTPTYHFVGHSLGNIIVRNGFHQQWRPGLGRIVMLAPPNHPPALADKFHNLAPYRWIMGDSGQQLASKELYAALPVPTVEFGVIAGDRGQSLLFDEPNDGVVTVESTKLDGMADWLLLHHTHTFMMNSGDTAEQVIYFLRNGSFKREDTAASGGGAG